MRSIYLITPIVVSLASGTVDSQWVQSGPGTDAIVDSYVFDASEVTANWPGSFDDYAAVDDFDPWYRGYIGITGFTCWGVTTGYPPFQLELLYVADASGMPEGAPVTQQLYGVSCVNTGYTYYGYTLWQAEFDLSIPPFFETPCWLGSHRADGTNWYPAAGSTVTGSEAYRTVAAGWAWQPFSASIGEGDLFKLIETWSWPPAIERNTWAGIKTAFE